MGRQLQIFRGVHPVIGVAGISPHKRPLAAIRDANALGFIVPGNDIVIILTGEANEESNDCATPLLNDGVAFDELRIIFLK